MEGQGKILLPSPDHISFLEGTADLRGVSISAPALNDAVQVVAEQLRKRLPRSRLGEARRNAAPVTLQMTSDTSTTGTYSLQAGREGLSIKAGTLDGLFNALQTLLQLTDPDTLLTPAVRVEDRPLFDYRAVHLDFRSNCLMPTFGYLLDILDLLGACKINVAIIEWEDKFPYAGHPELAAGEALTSDQVEELSSAAVANHIQLVPLLQGLGHVEYILKHRRYAHLRESATDISQFCPSEREARLVLRELMDELFAAHPQSRFIHLGGDETWVLGTCPRCSARVQEDGLMSLYVEHMSELCQYAIDAGRTPLIWGDVILGQHLRLLPDGQWRNEDARALDQLPRQVRMVYWDYHGTSPNDFHHFDDFERLGFTIWVAPTTRSSNIVPDYETHLPNITALLQAGIDHRAEGALITSWAWKNLPFELTWHGLLSGAERAWSGSRITQEELDRRAAHVFYGSELREFIEAFYLLSYDYWAQPFRMTDGARVRSSFLSSNPGIEHAIPDPRGVVKRALRAVGLLRASSTRAQFHVDTLGVWVVAAELVVHAARKQLLFDALEALLEDPLRLLDHKRVNGLRTEFEHLAAEREHLEEVWRAALERTNVQSSIMVDNALRFAGERAHTTYGIEQLRTLELAEGRRIWR